MNTGKYFIEKKLRSLWRITDVNSPKDIRIDNVYDFDCTYSKTITLTVTEKLIEKDYYPFTFNELRWLALRVDGTLQNSIRLLKNNILQFQFDKTHSRYIHKNLVALAKILITLKRETCKPTINLKFFTNSSNPVELHEQYLAYDDYVKSQNFSQDANDLYVCGLIGKEVETDSIDESAYFSIISDKTTLTYEISSEIDFIENSEFKTSGRMRWLFDEIEQLSESRYLHKIVFSNGFIFQIPFSHCYVQHEK